MAYGNLDEQLAEVVYEKAPLVEGDFKYETRQIDFTLIIDDFLIKYFHNEDLEHLCKALGKYSKFNVDVKAKQYVGIFEHEASTKPHYGPLCYAASQLGSRVQYVKVDKSPVLSKDKITFIQCIVGKLLYYARAVDPRMLHAINDIS